MKRAFLLSLGVIAISGCVSLNTPIQGFIFNDSKGPNTVGTGEGGAKTGTACSTGVLGFVTGDASINAAKAEGKISKVAYVDYTANSVLVFYAKYCTIVHGD